MTMPFRWEPAGELLRVSRFRDEPGLTEEVRPDRISGMQRAAL